MIAANAASSGTRRQRDYRSRHIEFMQRCLLGLRHEDPAQHRSSGALPACRQAATDFGTAQRCTDPIDAIDALWQKRK